MHCVLGVVAAALVGFVPAQCWVRDAVLQQALLLLHFDVELLEKGQVADVAI